ncbi:hypothetical protein HispidOSU_003265, partial [Sigmodon hispidus]
MEFDGLRIMEEGTEAMGVRQRCWWSFFAGLDSKNISAQGLEMSSVYLHNYLGSAKEVHHPDTAHKVLARGHHFQIKHRPEWHHPVSKETMFGKMSLIQKMVDSQER